MITAFITSCFFLSCYLIYHFNIPGHHVAFTATGWPRLIYFFILFTHLPLALAVVPLVIMTFIPALQKRFDRHKKIARWTLPIWLYVSVTGVLVYLMLYVLFPQA
jgi:putative membrane protein